MISLIEPRSSRAVDRFGLPPSPRLWFLIAPGPVVAGCADVAQLVEHHLAKVRVAGSNPVVRSEPGRWSADWRPTAVEWPRGEATACKAVYTGSNPVSTSHALK